MSGLGIQLAPPARPNVVFGADPADPERFLVRGRYARPRSLVALALVYLTTLGTIEALRDGSRAMLLVATLVAWAAVALAFLRSRLVFDRRRRALDEELVLLFAFARRRRPLDEIERVIVSRASDEGSHGEQTTYAVDLEAGDTRLRVDSAGLWEHATPLAEALARFLGLPLQDEQRAGELRHDQLDVPLQERPPEAEPPPPRRFHGSILVDHPALLRVVIPRPAVPQTLFLVGLVAAFCVVPLAAELLIPLVRGWRPGSLGVALHAALPPLVPILLVAAGALRHVASNGGVLSATPERLRFVRNGVVWKTALEIPATELEDLTLLEPELGGSRSLLAYFTAGALVARSDARSFRFGYGLSRGELAWLRHRIARVLRRSARPGRGPESGRDARPATPAGPIPVFPRWSRLWLGLLAGAVSARLFGGVLGICLAVPFLEELANLAALLGLLAGVAVSASVWRDQGARRLLAGLLALLLGVTAWGLLTGSDFVQPFPRFDEHAALATLADGGQAAADVSRSERLRAGLFVTSAAFHALALNLVLLAAFCVKGGRWRPRPSELAADAMRLVRSPEAAAPPRALAALAASGAAVAVLASGWRPSTDALWAEALELAATPPGAAPDGSGARVAGTARNAREPRLRLTPSAQLPPIIPWIESGGDPRLELQRLRGRPVLFLCWGADGLGTWLPDVDRLRRLYAPRGLEVVGIPALQDEARLRQILSTYRITWRQYLRPEAWRHQLPLAWPQTILVAPTGEILHADHPGRDTEERVAALLGPVPEEFAALTGALAGRILYAGRPLEEATTEAVHFWFRDEWSGREAQVQAEYERASSSYRLLAPAGTYLVDAGAGNRLDRAPHVAFSGTMVFALAAGELQHRDLSLQRILRMRQPIDNAQTLPPHGQLLAHRSPVRFAWDGLPEATRYEYVVRSSEAAESAPWAPGETSETALTLPLPPGRHNLRLSAHGQAGLIGRLEVYGENFRAWSYDFRVE